MSKIEGGTQRIDLIQLKEYCTACDVSLATFVKRFESKI
ncbi:hypothetical protein GLA29479_18 [Lysobacter antibioticus]|nr:hypothetical protein GLA29479_18 [Lysobacter antibioticus]